MYIYGPRLLIRYNIYEINELGLFMLIPDFVAVEQQKHRPACALRSLVSCFIVHCLESMIVEFYISIRIMDGLGLIRLFF